MTSNLTILTLILFLFNPKKDSCVFGNYHGQKKQATVNLTLNKDSTFHWNYITEPNGYKTCGTFSIKQDTIYLKDFQDSKTIKYDIDCDTKKIILIDTTGGLAIRKNIWTTFNEKSILKLKVNKNSVYWSDKQLMLKKE